MSPESPSICRGFPALGRVIEGLDLIKGIAAAESDGSTPVELLRGEILSHQVRIERMTVQRS